MASILDFYPDRFERLMTWARYLFWSDIHRHHFDAFLDTDHDVKDHRKGWEFVALMSAWYSSLWVVVEGWTEVPLSDPFVDQLLDASPRYKDLLKRYRNGVYHYQPRFNERRLLDFIHESEGTVPWTHFLHMEFCRFYWELVESFPADHLPKLREEIIQIVGWIPSDIPAARAQSAREQVQQAISMLREAGDFSSPAAQDVMRAAHGIVDEAAKLEVEFQKWKADILELVERQGGSGQVFKKPR